MIEETNEIADPEDISPEGVINDEVALRNKDGMSSFRGKPLRAWNGIRQVVAQKMGLRWGRIPVDELTEASNSGQYDGIAGDAIICVWLRLQRDEDIAGYFLKPREAFAQAMKWADENSIYYPSTPFIEVQSIFIQTVVDLNKVQGEYRSEAEPSKKRKNSSRRRG